MATLGLLGELPDDMDYFFDRRDDFSDELDKIIEDVFDEEDLPQDSLFDWDEEIENDPSAILRAPKEEQTVERWAAAAIDGDRRLLLFFPEEFSVDISERLKMELCKETVQSSTVVTDEDKRDVSQVLSIYDDSDSDEEANDSDYESS